MIKKILPKAIGYTLNQVSYLSPKRAGDFALRLFGTPMTRRSLPRDKEFLATAETTYQLPFEKGKVVVYEWNKGRKETVLLLHGWESNAARWKTLIQQLKAAGKCVLAVDAPAHGASSGKLFNMLQYSQVVALLVDQYAPDVIIGHSVGGGALALYLHNNPSTIVKKASILGVPSELRHMANAFADVMGLSQRARQTMEKSFESQYQLTFEQVSIAEYCKNIKIPMLVIHDEQDKIAAVEDAYVYENNLADCQLLITKGLRHSLQGEEVYQAIRRFVQ